MVGTLAQQEHDRQRRGQERREVDATLKPAEGGKPRGERDAQQEGQEHRHPGDDRPQFGAQLVELPIEGLLVPLLRVRCLLAPILSLHAVLPSAFCHHPATTP